VCKAVEEYGQRIAMQEKEESALKMIVRGKMSLEEIAEDLDLPLERVKQLAEIQVV
jgi:DNA-binding CsgD family transcriptional regulator